MIELENKKGDIQYKYYVKPSDIEVKGLCSQLFKAEFITSMQNYTGEVEIIIRKKKTRRTNPMNRYLWGEVNKKVAYGLRMKGYELNPAEVDQMLIDVLKLTTPELAHEYLKDKFGKEEYIDESTGEILETDGSTKQMPVKRMQEYWEVISKWAAEELQIIIKSPDQFKEEND